MVPQSTDPETFSCMSGGGKEAGSEGRYQCRTTLKINSTSPACRQLPTWPSASYQILTAPAFPPGRAPQHLTVSGTGNDQGWGNTGHCYIAIALCAPDGSPKETHWHGGTVSSLWCTKRNQRLSHWMLSLLWFLMQKKAMYTTL